MKKNRKWNENCYLITIEDPEFLLAKIIKDVLNHMLEVIDFKYIVFADVFCCSPIPNAVHNMIEQEGEIQLLKNFVKNLDNYESFESGDFYLFLENPFNLSAEMRPGYLMYQAETTITALDDHYIYIYTLYPQIVAQIQKKYSIESLSVGTIETFLSYTPGAAGDRG